jgi:hypothetical protein
MLRGRTILPAMTIGLVSIRDETTLNNNGLTLPVKTEIEVIHKEVIIPTTIILLLVHTTNRLPTKDNVHIIEKVTETLLHVHTEDQMILQARTVVIRHKIQINAGIIRHTTEAAIPEIGEIHRPDHIHQITGINEMILIIVHIHQDNNKSTDQHPHHGVMLHSRMPTNLSDSINI